jgi:hypothetical protein
MKPVRVWKAALLNKPKSKPPVKRPDSIYYSCTCSCCQNWRSFLEDLKTFNRSVMAPVDFQIVELEMLALDE